MKNQSIITNVRQSPYFGGGFRAYALHQWDIKYYKFENEFEINEALLYFFGQNLDILKDKFGVAFHIDGRSGGWLCCNAELTTKQLQSITQYVKDCLKQLPSFLKEERAFQKSQVDAEIQEVEAELQYLSKRVKKCTKKDKKYFTEIHAQKLALLKNLKEGN